EAHPREAAAAVPAARQAVQFSRLEAGSGRVDRRALAARARRRPGRAGVHEHGAEAARSLLLPAARDPSLDAEGMRPRAARGTRPRLPARARARAAALLVR